MIAQLIDSFRRGFALPLFARELTEASARRRTYIIRAVYAALLFTLAIVFARQFLFPVGDRFSVLGRGDELFLLVVMIQFAGIYLFLPAMTCTAITSEKERDTLGLLFLTRLTPSKIILEKFLGRIFPMISLLILSLPLFGIAYTLGGLEAWLIWEATVRLFAATAMVGAIGIVASAWCRTTAGAFFMTYVVLLVLYPGGPLFLAMLLDAMPSNEVMKVLNAPFEFLHLTTLHGRSAFLLIFFPPAALDTPLRAMPTGSAPSITSFALTLWQATPLLFVALCALAVARGVLVRRAASKPKHYAMHVLRWFDKTFCAVNDRFAFGIEIIKTGDMEIHDDPIAWRETTKTPLGAFRYLIRILMVVEVPVLIIGLSAVGGRSFGVLGGLMILAGCLWFGGCLLIAVKGALLFPLERSRQTLGVLLTTTLSTHDLLKQKLTGLWRLIAICTIPPATLFWMITYLSNALERLTWFEMIAGFTTMLCVVLTTYATVGYLAVFIGLRIPRVSRAVLSSVSLFVASCAVGPILYFVIWQKVAVLVTGSSLSLYSPVAALAEAMMIPEDPGKILVFLGGTLLLYGGLAFIFRNICYRLAARFLGRGEELIPPRLHTIQQQKEERKQKRLQQLRRHAQPEQVPG